jgi:large subunit ribosomal protein L20
MPRAKRGTKARSRRKRILKQTEGYFIGRKNKFKRAIETLQRGWAFAFRDRKQNKRNFRKLWITRLSAAVEQNGLSYSKFIHALNLSKIQLDRKVLAEIATHDPMAFTSVVKKAGAALTK